MSAALAACTSSHVVLASYQWCLAGTRYCRTSQGCTSCTRASMPYLYQDLYSGPRPDTRYEISNNCVPLAHLQVGNLVESHSLIITFPLVVGLQVSGLPSHPCSLTQCCRLNDRPRVFLIHIVVFFITTVVSFTLVAKLLSSLPLPPLTISYLILVCDFPGKRVIPC